MRTYEMIPTKDNQLPREKYLQWKNIVKIS